MRMRHIAVILLVVLLSGMLLACGNKAPKNRTIEGNLDSWSLEPPSITVDGTEYGLAKGMEAYLDNAEAGKRYKFTIDEYGNVIAVGKVGS